jgi:hypothetical protein
MATTTSQRKPATRKVTGSDPASFYGLVMDAGRPVWSCPHDHPTRGRARACAKRFLTILTRSTPTPASQQGAVATGRRSRLELTPYQGRRPVLRRSFLASLLGCAVYEPDTGENAAFGIAAHDAIHAYWHQCIAAGEESRLGDVREIVAQVLRLPRGLSFDRRDDLLELLDQFARTHLAELDALLWVDGRPAIEYELRADVGWAVITGQPDRINRVDGGDVDDPVEGVSCPDYKTSWQTSDDHLFQGRTYAQLAFLRWPSLQTFEWMPDPLYARHDPVPLLYVRGQLDEWWEDMLGSARAIWELRQSGRARPTGGSPCQYCDLRFACPGATLDAQLTPENDEQANEMAMSWLQAKEGLKAQRKGLAQYTARRKKPLTVNGKLVGWMTPDEARWVASDPLGIVSHATAAGYQGAKDWVVTWIDPRQVPKELKPALVEAGKARYELGPPQFKDRKVSRVKDETGGVIVLDDAQPNGAAAEGDGDSD